MRLWRPQCREHAGGCRTKGLGTPATCAATLSCGGRICGAEKETASPNGKRRQSDYGVAGQYQIPAAYCGMGIRLEQVEHGDVSADVFMDGIADMNRELVKAHTAPGGTVYQAVCSRQKRL
ncbi:MAG: hypothetical protein ACLT46_08890 [Hungatella sp.]